MAAWRRDGHHLAEQRARLGVRQRSSFGLVVGQCVTVTEWQAGKCPHRAGERAGSGYAEYREEFCRLMVGDPGVSQVRLTAPAPHP
jgi:hypothetical protein